MLLRRSMDSDRPAEITALLRAWGNGDGAALDRLTPLVYRELHRVARNRMRAERAGDNTIQTSALVNEVYLRMVNAEDVTFRDRTHFFAVSATMMRRILVDAARARHRKARIGSGPNQSK
jgi:RNA polymerase sigma factor (TIGR02999 family)